MTVYRRIKVSCMRRVHRSTFQHSQRQVGRDPVNRQAQRRVENMRAENRITTENLLETIKGWWTEDYRKGKRKTHRSMDGTSSTK